MSLSECLELASEVTKLVETKRKDQDFSVHTIYDLKKVASKKENGNTTAKKSDWIVPMTTNPINQQCSVACTNHINELRKEIEQLMAKVGLYNPQLASTIPSL